LRTTATRGTRDLPRRSRRSARHESSRAKAARDSDGPKELDVLLDRARCAAGRRNPKPARHLRAPRRRSLHLPRRRAPTHRSASPVAGSAAHAAAVEGALRERAAAIPAPSRPAVEIPPRDSLVVLCRWGKDAEVWPLTLGEPIRDPRRQRDRPALPEPRA